jgi:putative oxidoreductase
MNPAVYWYTRLIRYATFLCPIVLLLFRLAWGYELVQSGYGHLTHLDKTTQFFQSLHIPMPHANAVISGCTEFVGGWLLLVGLASRLICLPLIFNFCIAYATDGRDALHHIFTAPENVVDYTAFPFLMTALLILAFGPGLFSIDALLKRTVFKRQTTRGGFPVAGSTTF